MARSKMSLSEIFFMEGVTVFLLALLQIPTGALADKIGRKKNNRNKYVFVSSACGYISFYF
jgi:MFS family permease